MVKNPPRPNSHLDSSMQQAYRCRRKWFPKERQKIANFLFDATIWFSSHATFEAKVKAGLLSLLF